MKFTNIPPEQVRFDKRKNMTLRPIFTSIARKYIWINSIITLGLDKVWRQKCAKQCASGHVIVDLCCGTGDLSRTISAYSSGDVFLVGVDFNKEMLAEAILKDRQNRKHAKKDDKSLSFIVADAANLPFRETSVDRVGIAFGFRNLLYKNPNAKKHVLEIVRILQKDGQFVCVETSQPKNEFFRVLLHLYFKRIVPIIGWLISGRKSSYEYLGSSAANFKSAKELSNLLISLGFRKICFSHLTLGAAALHKATK